MEPNTGDGADHQQDRDLQGVSGAFLHDHDQPKHDHDACESSSNGSASSTHPKKLALDLAPKQYTANPPRELSHSTTSSQRVQLIVPMEVIDDIFENKRGEERRATHLEDGLTLLWTADGFRFRRQRNVSSGGVRSATLSRPGDYCSECVSRRVSALHSQLVSNPSHCLNYDVGRMAKNLLSVMSYDHISCPERFLYYPMSRALLFNT